MALIQSIKLKHQEKVKIGAKIPNRSGFSVAHQADLNNYHMVWWEFLDPIYHPHPPKNNNSLLQPPLLLSKPLWNLPSSSTMAGQPPFFIDDTLRADWESMINDLDGDDIKENLSQFLYLKDLSPAEAEPQPEAKGSNTTDAATTIVDEALAMQTTIDIRCQEDPLRFLESLCTDSEAEDFFLGLMIYYRCRKEVNPFDSPQALEEFTKNWVQLTGVPDASLLVMLQIKNLKKKHEERAANKPRKKDEDWTISLGNFIWGSKVILDGQDFTRFPYLAEGLNLISTGEYDEGLWKEGIRLMEESKLEDLNKQWEQLQEERFTPLINLHSLISFISHFERLQKERTKESKQEEMKNEQPEQFQEDSGWTMLTAFEKLKIEYWEKYQKKRTELLGKQQSMVTELITALEGAMTSHCLNP